MKAEQIVESGEVLVAWRGQIEPEEVIALEVIADMGLVDRVEGRDDEAKLLACAVDRRSFGLADRHGDLLRFVGGVVERQLVLAGGCAPANAPAAEQHATRLASSRLPTATATAPMRVFRVISEIPKRSTASARSVGASGSEPRLLPEASVSARAPPAAQLSTARSSSDAPTSRAPVKPTIAPTRSACRMGRALVQSWHSVARCGVREVSGRGRGQRHARGGWRRTGPTRSSRYCGCGSWTAAR
jgi:hypothetical protein